MPEKSSSSDVSSSSADTPATGSTITESQKSNDTELVLQSEKKNVPLLISKRYDPTLAGLEGAKIHCRFMMNRIVNEVDLVTKNPLIAQDETRVLPYMAPLLFKQLLPVSEIIATQLSDA